MLDVNWTQTRNRRLLFYHIVLLLHYYENMNSIVFEFEIDIYNLIRLKISLLFASKEGRIYRKYYIFTKFQLKASL